MRSRLILLIRTFRMFLLWLSKRVTLYVPQLLYPIHLSMDTSTAFPCSQLAALAAKQWDYVCPNLRTFPQDMLSQNLLGHEVVVLVFLMKFSL